VVSRKTRKKGVVKFRGVGTFEKNFENIIFWILMDSNSKLTWLNISIK